MLERSLNGVVPGWRVEYFPPEDQKDYASWSAEHPDLAWHSLSFWTGTLGVEGKEYWPCLTIRGGLTNFWYWLLDHVVWELTQQWSQEGISVVVSNDGVYQPRKPESTFKHHEKVHSTAVFPAYPEKAARHFKLRMEMFDKLELPAFPKTELWQTLVG